MSKVISLPRRSRGVAIRSAVLWLLSTAYGSRFALCPILLWQRCGTVSGAIDCRVRSILCCLPPLRLFSVANGRCRRIFLRLASPSPSPLPLLGERSSEEGDSQKRTDRDEVDQDAGAFSRVFHVRPRADASSPTHSVPRLLDRAVCLIMPSLIEMRNIVVEARREAARAHARLCSRASRTRLRLPLRLV